jgi:hypothetical protein
MVCKRSAVITNALVMNFTVIKRKLEVMNKSEQLENAVVESQKILAEWILPDSKTTDKECLGKLLGVLDSADLVRVQRGEKEQESGKEIVCEDSGNCYACGESRCEFHPSNKKSI